jgi:hypothetical protein
VGRHVNSFETHGRAHGGVPLARKGFRREISSRRAGRAEKQTITLTSASRALLVPLFRAATSSSPRLGADKFGFLFFTEPTWQCDILVGHKSSQFSFVHDDMFNVNNGNSEFVPDSIRNRNILRVRNMFIEQYE